jgi:hypothetical protein
MDVELSVITKTYELYKHFTNINATIPKLHRYGLGEKVLAQNLDLLANLIKAKNAPRATKAAYLLNASTNIEILRLELRLYLDLKLTNQTQVFQMQANLREIGREVGGWLRSTK